VTPSAAAPLREIAIAARMVGNLQAFPDAPMDELLDLRERLEPSRVRFRRALSTAAAQMEGKGFDAGLEREL
jgi:hypothetical protein